MSVRFYQTAYCHIREVVITHHSGNLIFHQEIDSWCFFRHTVGHYWYVLVIKATIAWVEMDEKKTVMGHTL